MKITILITLLVVQALCSIEFSQFVAQYSKEYSKDEHSYRQKVFLENIKKYEEHNRNKENTFKMGVNEHSDKTEEEFASIMFMRPISADSLKRMYGNIKVDNTTRSKDPLPTSFDWREKGAVAPVKNQGSCGSCWTYSTTGNIEGVNFLKYNKLVRLSQQQLIDCDKECGTDPVDGTKYCDSGCHGGWMMTAFQSIIKQGGIDTEESYDSFGKTNGCEFKADKIGAKLSSWKMLSNEEDTLAQQLIETGPISVAFDASPIMWYSSGIVTGRSCNPKTMSHAVLLVGFGEENGKKYWIVKNSWGSGWGEKGYFRILRGGNTCGIATVPCTSVIA